MQKNDLNALFSIPQQTDVKIFPGKDGYQKSREYLYSLKGENSDVLIREYTVAGGRRATIVLVDGMCSKELVESSVILASRRLDSSSDDNKFSPDDDMIQRFGTLEIKEEQSLSSGYISALTGDAFMIIEGETTGLILGYRSIESRSVGSSQGSSVVRGPHEAFTESIRVNTALLRRRISDPNFVIESTSIGERSHTSVAICYIRGVTATDLIERTRAKLSDICIDIINDSGELEQLIEDDPASIFPQIDGSEIPDVVAAELCSGRVAIIVNGSPFVLLIPATISRLMKVNEDDYQRWSYATFIKLLRWLAFFISVIGPGAYVAIISYHPGVLPTDLLIISVVNRLNVPFSALLEALLIEFSLELLREASIRMPKNISTSLAIVGGLIIGDAAISAGLVSPLLIIIAGISTIANFTIPSYSLASSMRLVKYLILLLSAILGLLGLVIGITLTISMMASTRSFDTDLTAPFAPFGKRGTISGLIELPAKYRTRRPDFFDPIDVIRYREGGKDSGN